MENNDFDKRMEFLKNSYDRMPSSFNPDEVLQKIEAGKKHPESAVRAKRTFRHKITVWTVGIASVFLFGFITALFVLEQRDTEKLTMTEEVQNLEEYRGELEIVRDSNAFIEALQKEYGIEREKRRKMLKLTEEKFDQLGFVHTADSRISLLEQESYRESVMSYTNGKELLKEHLERSIAILKLPSEMVGEISRTPLIADEQASIAFLDAYRGKVQDLVAAYDEMLKESVDIAEPIAKVMREQSIELYTNHNTDEIEAHYIVSALHQTVADNVHPNTLGYVGMIAQEPYMFGSSLLYPLEEFIPMLKNMEKTLLAVEKDSSLYLLLESYYVVGFNAIMTDVKETKGFDEPFRQSLRELASSGESTPIAYVVQPIIEELEASDWQFSKRLEMLEWDDIVNALVLARN